eukprot:TRINITY_DN6340_c0_g1_i1.p1 TRINITY_DN6340_c0_g1~~TRINITY_DN6340_c0_g1_i1.p1  ORF type:complete len:1385 (-),score=242.74 TRINITY_DN6340_c0_g1_i1:11-4165(-)
MQLLSQNLLVQEYLFYMYDSLSKNPNILSYDAALYSIDIPSCLNVLEECASCVSDSYCGFCSESGFCLFQNNCTRLSECPNTWSNEITCPEISRIAPFRGSSNGGTAVIASSNIADIPLVLSVANCNWDGDTIPATVSNGNIICTSPEAGSGGNNYLSIFVETPNCTGPYPFGISQPFSYYNCSSATNCVSCNAIGTECGWCYSEGVCSSKNECPLDKTEDNWKQGGSCPYQIDISPEIAESGEIVIQVTNLLEELTYGCLFEGGPLSVRVDAIKPVTKSVTKSNSTISNLWDVTCEVPLGYFRNVLVQVLVRNNLNQWISYTLSSSPLMLYDCSLVQSCGDYLVTNCSNPPFSGDCPEILNVDKKYIQIGSGFTDIMVTLSGITPSATLICDWDYSSYTSTVSVTGPDAISCSIPDTEIGPHSLRISSSDGLQLTGGYTITIFACTEISTCDKCTEYGCQFCGNYISGSCVSNCSGTTLTECVGIERVINPSDDILGGSEIVIEYSGTFSLDFYCSFINIDTGEEIKTEISQVSGNNVSCVAPQVDFPGSTIYKMGFGGYNNVITELYDFEYYDCGEFTNCEACHFSRDLYGYSKCGWCEGSCKSCEDAVCSEIISSVYSFGELVIEVTFIEQDLKYSCAFTDSNGNVFLTDEDKVNVTETTVICPVPSSLSYSIHRVNLEVNGVPYFTSSIEFEYPNCGVTETRCTDECFFNPLCSFCLDDNSCKLSGDCSISFSDSCPVVNKVEPNYTSLIVEQPFNVSVYVSGFNLTTETQGELGCFINGISSGYVLDDNTMLCEINPVTFTSRETPEVQIIHSKGDSTVSISKSSVKFSFVECSIEHVCSQEGDTCIDENNICGWCFDSSSSCTFQQDCPSGTKWLNNYTCPFISPTNANVSLAVEGQQFTLTGSNFVDHPYLLVEFFNFIVTKEVKYISDQELSVVLPERFDDNTTVNIRVFFGRSALSSVTIPLNVDDASVWIILVIAVLVLLGIVLLIILLRIFYFTKSEDPFAGLDIRPVEPHYESLVFPSEKKKILFVVPKDEFLDFEEALFHDPEMVLFRSFTESIGTEDQDKAAEAFVYLTEYLDTTYGFISFAIEQEIGITHDPATIFRGNSLASKMFKTYSRLIALPYVFNTIAYPVLELSALDQKKDINREDDAIELDMIDFDLEVDENKILEGMDRDTNTIYLKLVSSKIFQGIISSKNNIPSPLLNIFKLTKELIDEKFGEQDPDTLYYAVGGLFFLRFLIPSLFTPHVYGLLQEPPHPNTQRKLVLISKVIQSIANMSLPGKKEPFMESLTPFIQNNIPKIKLFYEDIMKGASTQDEPKVMDIPDSVRLNSLSNLWNMFKHKAEKVKAKLKETGNDTGIVDELMSKYSQFAEKKRK